MTKPRFEIGQTVTVDDCPARVVGYEDGSQRRGCPAEWIYLLAVEGREGATEAVESDVSAA